MMQLFEHAPDRRRHPPLGRVQKVDAMPSEPPVSFLKIRGKFIEQMTNYFQAMQGLASRQAARAQVSVQRPCTELCTN